MSFNTIYYQFVQYSQPPIIILGTIGAILNQIIFSQKSLRMSSCSLYFRILSANDLLALYIIILPLWISIQYGIDLSHNHAWLCKLKTFITDSLYTISPYLVVLACFDRFCTSSANVRLRKLATIRAASYLISCSILLIFLAYFHIFIGYNVFQYGSTSYCITTDRFYSQFIALFVLFFLCISPPIFMIIFCCITLIFFRQHRRRIMPINQARLHQVDNQLLKMLFLYVTLTVICTVPFAVTYVMLMFQQSRYVLLDLLLFRLFNLLLNVNFSTSFYAYTLGTPFYRKEVWRLLKKMKTKFLKLNQIHICRRIKNGTITN